MNFIRKALEENGFVGFKKISKIRVDYSELPEKSGLYCVLYTGKHEPEFIEPGTGAFLKNRNPNVEIKKLEKKWVDNATVIYIGQTKQTLKRRIRAYLEFGEKKKYPHWGGRYIWQIKNNNDLVLCWKLLTNKNSREFEKELIAKFEEKYNSRRPFANHQR